MTGLIIFYVRSLGRWLVPFLVALVMLGLVGLANPEVETGERRVLSVDQVIENLESIFGSSTDPASRAPGAGASFGGARSWTTRSPARTSGAARDSAVNLAIEDGFESDPGLRAPHNAHIHILARTGVPGAGALDRPSGRLRE